MRSVLLLLCASGAASACTGDSCDSDGNSLLQARSLVRKGAIATELTDADALLQSVKEVANSLTKNSVATMTPDEVNTAVGAAATAVSGLVPTFAEQHAAAQHEINNQFREIEACHSGSHGTTARANQAATLSTHRDNKHECDEAVVSAIETETRECDEWRTEANELSSVLPACGPSSTPDELTNIATNWAPLGQQLASIVSQDSECKEATALLQAREETCATMTLAYEESYCRQSLSCHMVTNCHAHEAAIYLELRTDVEAGMTARQQQYRTVRQSECILELIMTSLRTSTPINDDSLTSCDDVNVDDLNIAFHDLPQEPPACPARQGGDPVCDPAPRVGDWTNGQASGHIIDLSNLQPAEGSPSGCECTVVDLQGVYSAGPVIRCDQCLSVSQSTEQDSCPSGWKIFSPRNRADWEVLGASLNLNELRSPHLIVDVTRPEDGCGGCTGAAMNSDSPAQSSWVTSDGSPWWLRDSPFGEPNGDYHANCYMYVHRPENPADIFFNDASAGHCHYSASSYLCQPMANSITSPAGAPLAGLQIDSGLTAPPDLPWRLALNIDTDDDNVVNYANTGFWEDETELGGATSDSSSALTQDYKDPSVFGSGSVSQVLVVVHNEGSLLGWRRWRTTQSHSSLRDYFTASGSNKCGGAAFGAAGSVQLAAETIDAEEGSLDAEHEPFVTNRGNNNELWINAGNGDDYNRLSTVMNPPNNLGYGLGTAYDIRSCGVTLRPQADAQLHTDNHHWGSGGGIGGLIGTDHICGNGAACPDGRCGQCPWTVLSGLQYDFAIYVV